jgi:hypothetical protein
VLQELNKISLAATFSVLIWQRDCSIKIPEDLKIHHAVTFLEKIACGDLLGK